MNRGFRIQFNTAALTQLHSLNEPFAGSKAVDMTSRLWSSIDNDDSRDLDQVEYAAQEPGGTRIYIGIADVDCYVPKGSALDEEALQNTTSIYTGVVVFPMLPEELSTDRSSLNENQKRLAIVSEMLVSEDGVVTESSVYPAIVQNKAQLTYEGVAAWIDKKTDGHATEASQRTWQKIRTIPGLEEQIRLQDKAADALRLRRHELGALTFQNVELQPVMSAEGEVVDLHERRQNQASFIIEDFMIAANETTATFLDRMQMPSIQRVVREPERWNRIVELAASLGGHLPSAPDSKRLEAFLQQRRRVDPTHFPELSLSIIKLLGRGEYMVRRRGEDPTGHFGLAVPNYSHSTAPNRRYPDLTTQRLIKAAWYGQESPYSVADLEAIAKRCTEMENEANKVERFVKKAAAASILISQVGKVFEAVVTGASAKGTWVRLLHPPVEGKLLDPADVDVGHRMRVRLVRVSVERGFIDFETAS